MHVFNVKSKTRTMIEVERYSPMRPATNYLETPFFNGQKLQELKSREFQRTDKRLSYGWLQYQGSGRLLFVHRYLGWSLLRPNSSRSSHPQRQKPNLFHIGDCSRAMIQNTKFE